MQVIIAQHEIGNVVGHRHEQFVTFLARQILFLRDVTEQDLDIDFTVRAVNAGRIVYEIGVNASTGKAVFNTSQLSQTEIAAFADDFAAQLVRVYPYGIIAAVSDIGMAFITGFRVGTDAAVP